jgi:hypothetical protein
MVESAKRRVDSRRRSTTIALAPVALACWLGGGGVARGEDPPDLALGATPSTAGTAPATTLDLGTLRPGDRRLVDGETRLRLVPRVGGGLGFVTGHVAPFAHTIGLTEVGGELTYEVIPWGGWLQGTFESSGEDGKWTAPSVAGGFSYRFFGDGVDAFSLLFRGGVVWEPWHANSSACAVYLFFPSGCVSLPPRNPDGTTPVGFKSYDDNGQDLGLLAGVRVEAPIHWMYLAFDASFVPTVDVSSSVPGATFGFRFALLAGFRDRRDKDAKKGDSTAAPDDRAINKRR